MHSQASTSAGRSRTSRSYDSGPARSLVHKVRSSPDDPSRALVEGIAELCALAPVETDALDGVLHGTTIATNAVLEHRGARTGLITTEGVRDVLHIGRHQRPEPYSVMQDMPVAGPPVRRGAERLDGAGAHRAAARRRGARRSTRTPCAPPPRELSEAGVEAVAVCFLFSYLDPTHEKRAAQIVRDAMPDAFVTTSADVSPQFREFERFTTTAMNAFVGPGTGSVPRPPRPRGSRAEASPPSSS